MRMMTKRQRQIGRATLAAVLLGLPLTTGVGAQDTSSPQPSATPQVQSQATPTAPIQSPVLSIDSEQFFRGSAFGLRVIAEYQDALRALDVENTRIADELRAEEQALTAQRAQLDSATFAKMADAFHERVQGIRREQTAKQQVIESRVELAERRFLAAAFPVVEALMTERGAAIIVEKRNVYATNLSIEITDDAIARINAELGDGLAFIAGQSGQTGTDDGTNTETDAAPAPENAPQAGNDN